MNDTTEVLQPEAESEEFGTQLRSKRSVRKLVFGLFSIALAVVLIVYVLPRIAGTTSHDVRVAFKSLSLNEAIVLTILWAAGIFAHSFVLTGSLPRLTRSRALTLNMTGSAISNVMPFGGAFGMSLNYLMIRSWGIDTASFTSFTFVSNLWVVLQKLMLPFVAVIALVLTGGAVTGSLLWVSLGSTAALLVLVLVMAGALASHRVARWVLSGIATPICALARLIRRPGDKEKFIAAGLISRDEAAEVITGRWLQLSAGMLVYGVLQAVLLWACLRAVGGPISPVFVLVAFAVDRFATLVAITPGAAGFAEAGAVGVLVALGGAPAAMAAGVLLYRVFTFALEIPVGGSWLAGWLYLRRKSGHGRVPVAAEAD